VAILKNKANQLETQRSLLPFKDEQGRLQAEYSLQVCYYNICLLMKNNELTEYQIDLLDTQISVAKERLWMGEATQNEVDLLVAQKLSAEMAIKTNESKIALLKRSLAAMVDGDPGHLNVEFFIPETVPPYTKKYETVRDGLLKTMSP